MPRQTPRVTCPACSHEFDFGGAAGECWWCHAPIAKTGNRRYCSPKCRVAGRNYRQYQKSKDDPKRKAYKREYMRNYMRTYRKGEPGYAK